MSAVGSALNSGGQSAVQHLQSRKPASSAEEKTETPEEKARERRVGEEGAEVRSLQLHADQGVGGEVDQIG
ncbi:MAG: hypothetical protein IT369_10310 [Candidatus Latescibacteria bacterium]|nr:hypothetical protein [Candidatus Latescibacterota bacterium]